MGAPHTWQFDAPDGVYKNNYLSNELLLQSVAKMKVVPFTRPFDGFGKKKGEYVNIMHIKELPDPVSAQLDEDTKIPIDKLIMGQRVIKVVPWGRGVEYTHLSESLAKFDPGDYTQKALMRQMERAMDTAAADAFMGTDAKICFIPTGIASGTWDLDGTPSTVATSNLSFDHMGILADYLTGDIHVPPFEGEDFIMLSCRKNLRGLKQDALWQQVHLYLQKGDLFFRGEVGKAENIRCVQVDREAAFSNTSGTSTKIGESVLFGDEAVIRIDVESPHLRAEPNLGTNFGLLKAVAWYGILAFASLWETANDGEAKIIKVCSA
jgi:N4-gp56 family major capsid protein